MCPIAGGNWNNGGNAGVWAPDETLSSRAYRADRDGNIFGRIFRPAIDTLFFWQASHCYAAYVAEVQRRQYSANFR